MTIEELQARIERLEKVLSAYGEELKLAYSYIQPDAASSLTKSRIVLERLVLQVYGLEMETAPRKPLLGEVLADNQFTRKIDRRILSRMNGIRDLANLGPHGEKVEPSDATRVLDDLCEVLDWYLKRYGQRGQAEFGPVPPAGWLRLTVHLAYFAGNPVRCCFINATNLLRDTDLEITHIWIEAGSQVHALNEDRPLPKRLKPHESWESWVELWKLPRELPEDAVYRLARARLSTGEIVESVRNEHVPEMGAVPGGRITRPPSGL
jgi:hypothetical protein